MDISVIIPCKNEVGTIEHLLDCLVRQTLQPAEVVIVDSRSKDHLAAAIEPYKQHLPIKLYETSLHGVSPARNLGAEHATNRYLLFVDADTQLADDFIERLDRAVQRTGAEVGAILESARERQIFLRLGTAFVNSYMRIMGHTPWPIAIGSCIFSSRRAHELIKGFDATLFIMEDYDYVMRAKQAGAVFRVMPVSHYVSLRRYQGMKGLQQVFKGMYGELYRYTHGLRITKPIYTYEMGGQANRPTTPAEETTKPSS